MALLDNAAPAIEAQTLMPGELAKQIMRSLVFVMLLTSIFAVLTLLSHHLFSKSSRLPHPDTHIVQQMAKVRSVETVTAIDRELLPSLP